MKIWHISDTHGYHDMVPIPKDVDMVIHSGDASNYREPFKNEPEMRQFLTWYEALPIKHKIYVAGNHDTSIERGLIDKMKFEELGITYLENEYVTIEGIKFFGSPHTPTFGDWAFMKARAKIGRVWDTIEEDTDVVIVHGPPKGALDLSYDRQNNLEMCGCAALRKRVYNLNLKAILFGHIHNGKDIRNFGVLHRDGMIYSNGSVCTDGKFGTLVNPGNIIEL